MANEVSYRHSSTGSTLYFTIRNVSRQMWNTAGTPNFETLTVANWTSYDVAMTESPASSYFYAGTFPAISGNMVAGWYWVELFSQTGGSPAIGDSLVASYFGYWDGTTFKHWANDTTHVSGTAQTAGDLKTLIDAVQADLPQRITKNTALSGFPFLMVDSSDHSTPKTGLTVTATRSLDGAAFASCTNSVSEIGNGFYKLDLAAADLNGNTVALKFTATGADQRSITLVTQPT